jgi:Flp pilus assembly pilin Flp
MKRIWKFLVRDDGTTSVEYAVLLALILLTTIAGVRTLTNGASGMWDNNNDKLNAAGFATSAP